MGLALRRAQAKEFAAIARLMNAAYRGAGPEASWNTEAGVIEGDRTSEAALAEETAGKPEAFLLVAKEDAWPAGAEGLLGCVWLEPMSQEPIARGIWYLGSLTVDPKLQKGGMGRELLAGAEEWARARGASTIQMKVVQVRETLIAWYERRGYRRTGETHAFPNGDTRFGRPLREGLEFVVLEKVF